MHTIFVNRSAKINFTCRDEYCKSDLGSPLPLADLVSPGIMSAAVAHFFIPNQGKVPFFTEAASQKKTEPKMWPNMNDIAPFNKTTRSLDNGQLGRAPDS